MNKKYFLISEICHICQLPLHKLRYIEKTDKKFSVIKIRNRRYYTKQNIDYLLTNYAAPEIDLKTQLEKIAQLKSNKKNPTSSQLLSKIDQLVHKFSTLL